MMISTTCMVSDRLSNRNPINCIFSSPCMWWRLNSAACSLTSQSHAGRKSRRRSKVLTFSFQSGSRESRNPDYFHQCSLSMRRKGWKMHACLSAASRPHHHPHPQLGRPGCQAHSHSWARRCAGVGSMMCLCATAQWAATVRRPWSWWLSWRHHPKASAASCSTETTVQEVQCPRSSARPWRTATSGLCSSRLTSCRTTGVNTWCTRLWPRDLCPIGSSRCIRTCNRPTILRNYASSALSTWTRTRREATLASPWHWTRVSMVHSLCR